MPDSAHREPVVEVEIEHGRITLLGTAHVSRASADKVRELLAEGDFDAVAVELCPSRYQALIDPDALSKIDLFQVVRQGKATLVAGQLALGAFQQRLAEQFDIEPGAEQRAAISEAEQRGLQLLCIDRDIGTTLKRTLANVPWWKRMGLFSALIASVLSRQEVSEQEIEALKEGDMLDATFAEFAEDRSEIYQPLIAERDRYMAAKLIEALRDKPGRHILAVLGAGHLAGTQAALAEGMPDTASTIAELETLPEKTRVWRFVPWLIVLLVFIGFGIGFARSPSLGWSLVWDWVLINGSLSALGALIAGGHPGTVLTAFVAAPITSLNPTVGAGMATAAAELYFRKPTVGDFSRLRHDTTHWKGWWHNRVSRTLLVFIFSTLGSAVGTWLAGFRIFDKLT